MKKILMFLACFVFVAQVVFAAYVEVNPASGSSSAVTINKDDTFFDVVSGVTGSVSNTYWFIIEPGSSFLLTSQVNAFDVYTVGGGSPVNYWTSFTSSWRDSSDNSVDISKALSAGIYQLVIEGAVRIGSPLASAPSYNFTVTAQPVPLPAAAWLLGSALMGLVVARKRRS